MVISKNSSLQYGKKLWRVCAINTDEGNAQVKLSFLHLSGRSPSYTFPSQPYILLMPIQDILTVFNTPLPNNSNGESLQYK